jgi:hypothetical protein
MADDRSPDPHTELAAKIRFDVPHSARIWNYWMGGKDNSTKIYVHVGHGLVDDLRKFTNLDPSRSS